MTTTLLAAVRRMEAALVALGGSEQKDDLAHAVYSLSHNLSQTLVEWLRTDGAVYFYPNPLPVTKNVPKE